ncbi:MAG: FKBP-type peptidylprolyl isomerase [bacterium P3]|nr:MAG: FKBP-type peptidylprolyl isomerase [bacterium P3]KWW40660.1 MAG: FKBP-type peptidylprolyl isomerase [bacterium F083]
MKNSVKFAVLMLAAAVMATSCNKSDISGFKKTKGGLHYKFETKNRSGEGIHVGDVIVGKMVFRLDTTVLFTNAGDPQRLMMVRDSVFNGYDIDEGLLMMHEGEKAVFAIYADSVARYFQPNQLPPSYKPGSDMVFYYEITVSGVVTREELQEEQENFREEMQQRQKEEPELLAKYIADNNITVQPNADGLYVIVNKRGNGPRVAMGKTVMMNYTGRLLDGTMFDSSVESDAKEGGIYNAQRTYEPLSYEVGKMSLIRGWEDGVSGLPQGSQVTLIMPSSLGYGAQGAGQTILPYSPLRFDIEIVSVK